MSFIGALSATMVECIDLALDNSGELVRYQGGYWAPRGKAHPALGGVEYFGGRTVEALVSRGCAEYSEWRDGRNGQFPIAMKLIVQSPAISA